jgi:stearoyl-CoA desaturase (delta-9 desaturase)
VVAGVIEHNLRALRRERVTALFVYVTPLVGLIAAIVLLWGRGVGGVELGLLLGMHAVGMIGIGLGFHRLLSHAALETTPAVRAVLAVFGSIAAQGPVFFWVANHRCHHLYTDRPGDPHSPNLHGGGIHGLVRGFWHAHVVWIFRTKISEWRFFILDLVRDPTLHTINRLYFLWVLLGLAIPAAIGGAAAGTWTGAFLGFLWGGLVRICVGHHVISCVNSICHLYGSTPFKCRDESKNNVWVALPSFGEGWHNNHHTFPYSALEGLKWWQVDLNGICIRALQLVGLVWNVKVPSAEALQAARRQ